MGVEKDISNNRSQPEQSDSRDEEPIHHEGCQINTEYIRPQDEIEHRLLLHWKKLCEENYSDIQTEINKIHRTEVRIEKLQKEDQKIYPKYRAKIKQLQKIRRELVSLARKYPNCIIRDGRLLIPLSRQECRNRMYRCLQDCFIVPNQSAMRDMLVNYQRTMDRRRFGCHFDRTFYTKYGRTSMRKIFRILEDEHEDMTPDFVASTKIYYNPVVKILIRGRSFIFKNNSVVQTLGRIREGTEPEKSKSHDDVAKQNVMCASPFTKQSPNRQEILRHSDPDLKCNIEGECDESGDSMESVLSSFDDAEKNGTMAEEIYRPTSQHLPIRAFSRATPLPRILSLQSHKRTDENVCIIEGHAVKKRPFSGPEILSKPSLPLKVTRELPPLLNSRASLSKQTRKHSGFDLETKHLEKKHNKMHTNQKNIRPNSPVKRNHKIYRTPHHVDISYRGLERNTEAKLERPLPLPPIKDQNRHRKSH